MRTTWRAEILQAMAGTGDTLNDVEAIEPFVTDWLDVEFDNGYGAIEGQPFTAWTEGSVYFPVQYDGGEWCASVPRHPSPHRSAVKHIGGS